MSFHINCHINLSYKSKYWPHLNAANAQGTINHLLDIKLHLSFSIPHGKCRQTHSAGTQGNFYARLIFRFEFFQGRCAMCLLQMYACCLLDSTVGIEWIGAGFLPDGFCELPLSHPCKHRACSGLPGCTSTLWLCTKSECLVSQKIVSILWFIRSLWYPRLPLFCTITNYISLSYFDNPFN